jgi:diguanylate cyclase (GGDEF)-like protein
LKRFGGVMGATTRASNICGRMGGEEFLLVITHVDRENIHSTVDRLRQKFEAEKFVFGGKQVSVTCSFGVAGFQGQKAPQLAQLICEADRALYAAKRAGRNRVEVAAYQEVR